MPTAPVFGPPSPVLAPLNVPHQDGVSPDAFGAQFGNQLQSTASQVGGAVDARIQQDEQQRQQEAAAQARASQSRAQDSINAYSVEKNRKVAEISTLQGNDAYGAEQQFHTWSSDTTAKYEEGLKGDPIALAHFRMGAALASADGSTSSYAHEHKEVVGAAISTETAGIQNAADIYKTNATAAPAIAEHARVAMADAVQRRGSLRGDPDAQIKLDIHITDSAAQADAVIFRMKTNNLSDARALFEKTRGNMTTEDEGKTAQALGISENTTMVMSSADVAMSASIKAGTIANVPDYSAGDHALLEMLTAGKIDKPTYEMARQSFKDLAANHERHVNEVVKAVNKQATDAIYSDPSNPQAGNQWLKANADKAQFVDRDALYRNQKSVAQPKPANQLLVSTMRELAANDPIRFKTVNLPSLRGELGSSYNGLSDIQSKIGTQDWQQERFQKDQGVARQATDVALAQVAGTTRAKDPETAATIHNSTAAWIDETRTDGQRPTPRQIQDHAVDIATQLKNGVDARQYEPLPNYFVAGGSQTEQDLIENAPGSKVYEARVGTLNNWAAQVAHSSQLGVNTEKTSPQVTAYNAGLAALAGGDLRAADKVRSDPTLKGLPAVQRELEVIKALQIVRANREKEAAAKALEESSKGTGRSGTFGGL